jgi:hypothetical protein
LFTSIFNFRDLGGIAVSSGKTVRSGRLYRSDSLANLTVSDVEILDRLGVRTVIDLQRAEEVARLGRVPDSPGRVYRNIVPEHALWDLADSYDEAAGPPRYLADRYLDMVRDGHAGMVEALAVLADPRQTPAVVHCLAGKDRTGVLIALTLGLLGASDTAIAEDYSRSEAWSVAHAPAELPRHWVGAPREAMIIFLKDFKQRYGSLERYVLDAGLARADIESLRDNLLV